MTLYIAAKLLVNVKMFEMTNKIKTGGIYVNTSCWQETNKTPQTYQQAQL